jgi:adenylate cyclase
VIRARAAWPALLVTALSLAIWLALPGMREALRERSADLLLPPLPATDDIVVVDIDREALDRFGPWPWPRARLAALLEAIAAARPAAIAVDMLLAEPDRLSPAALARQLGEAAGRPDIAALAATLEDGDARLASAIGAAPTGLGFVLEPRATEDTLPAVPILVQGVVALPGLWIAPGLQGPAPSLAAAAEGLGLLVLDADADGRIRRAPLLALAGDTARPGLAVEALRLGEGAGVLVLEADPARLRIGDLAVPLDGTARLRLPPPDPARWDARSIPAARLEAAVERLAGRIVVFGGSAPELGGLRPAAGGIVAPSVQVQADAVAALRQGRVLLRPDWLAPAEALAAALLLAAALAAGLWLRPRHAAPLVALGCAAWVAGCAIAFRAGLLPDPAGPPLLAALGFAAASLAAFATTERRARALRDRFAQRLPDAVVRRIAAAPEALRLTGEMREITALFTDIEGFTAMTERAAPEELVALLDAYLDALTRIVVAHGGMVEKIVGDALHVVFNAPLDLPDHARAAHDCALALLAESEAQRATPLGRRLALGRTRIGIETGMAVVGDVGGAGKLDYTAHGNVMNTAARLEAANKELGSSICIGPVAAARIGVERLRPLGRLPVRGRAEPLDLYTTP